MSKPDFLAVGRWMHEHMAWGEPTPEKYAELMQEAFENGPFRQDEKLRVLILALEDWDPLFDWGEPFDGYEEEKALHCAFRAYRTPQGRDEP